MSYGYQNWVKQDTAPLLQLSTYIRDFSQSPLDLFKWSDSEQNVHFSS